MNKIRKEISGYIDEYQVLLIFAPILIPVVFVVGVWVLFWGRFLSMMDKL